MSASPRLNIAAGPAHGVCLWAILALSACGGGAASDAPASTPDAGQADAARSDASSPDAARSDASQADAARTDAAQGDADPAPQPDASSPEADAGAPPIDVAAFIPDAAAAICGALFRCCDADSQRRYFEPYAQNEALADFVDRLPPAAIVDAATCPGLVAEMLTVMPFGRWVAAASDGLVAPAPAATAACIETLATAACGEPLTRALFDSTCFWIGPPAGGAEQRSVFQRTAGPGAACRPLNDGFGGVFFGTCDPQRAFCCHGEAGACDFPDGPEAVGTCRPVSVEGEACSQLPVQLCRTGLECGDDGFCHAPDLTPLGNGEACVDARFNLLGECADGYCDVLGEGTCRPRRADGEACAGADECQSFSCLDGQCATPRFCVAP